jgi:hypothetical protein
MHGTIQDQRRKLTEETVKAIRRDFSIGFTRKQVAKKHGTSLSNLDAIIARKTWKTI